jgi:predicted PP-loop superfamily ATPase
MSKKVAMPASMDFYQDNTKLKWIILAVSVVISVGSIYYTNFLVDQLKEREKQQVELFAKALEYINRSEESIDFVTNEIIFKNKSIPVIWITT